LIEISGQEPADLGEQKLVELAQKSDIDLANLVHPDVIRRASPVQNVSSDPVICRNSTSPLRRTVGLGDNVDPFALGSQLSHQFLYEVRLASPSDSKNQQRESVEDRAPCALL